MTTWTRSALLVSASIVFACGSADDKGLFNGDGGSGGGYSGGGGTSASGGSGGTSASGGSGGTTGGSGGSGATGGATGGGSGGVTGGGTGGGTGGVTGGGTGGTGGTGGIGGATGGAPGGGGGPSGGGGTGGGPTGSCVGQCGSSQPQPGNCYCDTQCEQVGDCCSDYATECSVTTTGSVPCGSQTCTGGVTFCCFNPKTCNPVEAQCSGPDLYCNGPEDCQGTDAVCCSTPVPNQPGNYNLRCQKKGACTGAARVICGSQPSVCEAGESCVPHPTLPVNYCS